MGKMERIKEEKFSLNIVKNKNYWLRKEKYMGII